MKKNIDMLNGPVFKGILSFTIPVILTNLLQNLFHTADLIVVGQYCGSLSVAAVSATTYLTSLIISFFIGISTGTGICVARAIGAHQEKDVYRFVHTALPAAMICGGLVSLIGVIFSPTFLKWMGTPENVLPLSSVYMRIYFAGMVFNMVYNFSASILRSAGETKLTLYFSTIAGLLNVGLNILFVTAFKMNVAGVALATTISQAVSAILAVVALTRRTDMCKLFIGQIRIYGKQLYLMLRHGLPAGIQISLLSVSNVIIVSSINSFGSDAIIAGNGAALSLECLHSSVTSGFYTAQVNFVGQNAGAHKFNRVKKIYRTCLASMLCMEIAVSALTYLFRIPLLSLYITDNAEAITYGILRITYINLFYGILSCMDNTGGALRGLGYSIAPTIITLAGSCGFQILWVYTIFQIPQCHTLPCLYQSYPISGLLTFLVHLIVFLTAIKKKAAESIMPQRSII